MRYDIIHIILPIMIGLLCATSCSSDPDSFVPNSGKGEEVRFEVADCTTRATTITTASNLTAQPFMLFGDVYRNGEFHSGLKTIFNKAKVTYTNNRWDYGAKQYWNMGQEHSFVAIHPYDIKGISNLKYEGSEVSFTYAMPEQKINELESDIKDIVVATHRRKYNLDNAEPVQFKFQHLLTRINVAPALHQEDHMYPADDEDRKEIEFGYDLIRNEFIQIRKVEMSGFYTKANVSVTPVPLSGSQSDDNVVTIDVDKSSEKATIAVEIAEEQSPHIFNDGKNVTVLDNTVAIMMIPQTFEDDAQIKLEYTVNTDNTESKELRYVIVPLKSTTLERGKSYTMKFTIENVYKGQIQDGSVKFELNDNDITDSEYKFNWIDNEGGTIRQEFDIN